MPNMDARMFRIVAALALILTLHAPVRTEIVSNGTITNGNAAFETPPRLDQAKMHAEYSDGNFEVVLATLEGLERSQQPYGLEDSVFIAKYLAVIHCANPHTREKGRYYMNRLLELRPSANLVGMYVSEEIDRIFEKVREEFLARQRSLETNKSLGLESGHAPEIPGGSREVRGPAVEKKNGNDSRGIGPANTGKNGKGGKVWLWVAAGAGVAGAVALYLLHPSRPQDEIYVVQ